MEQALKHRCISRINSMIVSGPGRVAVVVILLFSLSPISVRAGDLLDAYILALKNDPRFIGAGYENAATKETLKRAWGGLMPTVSAEAFYMNTDQEILSSDNVFYSLGKSSYPTKAYTLSLKQPLFNYASIIGVNRAKADVKGADMKLEVAKQELIVRLARAYLGVLASRDNLDFAKVEEAAVIRHFELISSKFASGLAPKTDHLDAKARLSEVKANRIVAESSMDDAIQAMREIVGDEVSSFAVLREELPLITPDPEDIDSWMKAALKQNPALEAQQQAVEAAHQEYRRQMAGHYPQLNLEANYNWNKAEGTLFGGGSEVETTNWLVRLSVPLFEGGIIRANTREALNLYKAALQEEERQARALNKETRAAYLGIVSAIDRVKALNEAVESQKLAREAKEEGYKSGLFTILAVLDSERDLYRTKQSYAIARYDYIFNSLRLKKAAGTLNESDIIAVNSWMEESH
jgi:outer membrane protein